MRKEIEKFCDRINKIHNNSNYIFIPIKYQLKINVTTN